MHVLRSLRFCPLLGVCAALSAAAAEPDFRIEVQAVRSGFDGVYGWMNPMVGAIPVAAQDPLLVLTLQKALLTASDVYFAVNDMRSEDFGRTWSSPVEHNELGRRPGPDGMKIGLTSLAPKWNAARGKLLATGGTSFYRGDLLDREGPERPAFSVYDEVHRVWSPWATLEVPKETRFYKADSGCCQRVDLPDGTVLLPAYFKGKGITAYGSTVFRCAFDGRTLTALGHGDELTLPFDPASLDPTFSFDKRQGLARQSGLFEPSLTRFQGRYFLTMRNVKDDYVATGPDGQHFDRPREWTFDDGRVLGSENTQTHWVSPGTKLYLIYTRRGAHNDHVFRHRAPIFMAEVDTERLCLRRATEQVLIPEQGAGLGNCIGVTDVTSGETWVTTAESMQNGGRDMADSTLQKRRGANNRSWAARIIWSQPSAAAATPAAAPAASAAPLVLLQGPACRVPLGAPGDDGAGWAQAPALPEMRAPALRPEAPPRTTVRALAQEDALYVRFDCETRDPRTLVEGADGGDRVWVEVYPHNDPVERLRFEEDFRGDRKIARLRRITGESSLRVVPDVWEGKAPLALGQGDVPIYHGLKPGGWYAEFVLSWKALGLPGRPATVGLGYGRRFGDVAPRAVRWEARWPAADATQPWAGDLEPGQALLGDAVAPIAWETDSPRFGANRGHLVFASALAQPLRLRVRTVGPVGAAGEAEIPVPAGATAADFTYQLFRAFDSHLDVFHPQRVVLDLRSPDGAMKYTASVPFGRHLGVCIDEPFGEVASAAAVRPNEGREAWLDRVERALPRLDRRTTREGAPSDYSLVYANGTVAANLMADDAWARLAGLVESRFASTEDRLVGAMALIGQKSVTNLILDPLYFNPTGEQYYHSAMNEHMGPLSLLRYGGGPAVSRAAVLARLLQHLTDPATGRPFVTRVISLRKRGGPEQTGRRYDGVKNLAPFVEQPGRIGAVAVDYRGSQTLLDPTGLAFFPAGSQLASVERIRDDAALRLAGSGRLADAYGRIDIDEIRHEPTDRLLSRGVFPEQAAEEDGQDRPYDMGYRLVAPIVVAGSAAAVGGFVDEWRRPGHRQAGVRVAVTEKGWRITVAVRGVDWAALTDKDRAWERVHVLVDPGHDHFAFRHFMAAAAGGRDAWAEEAEQIQTFAKHLATENWREVASLGREGWRAEISAAPEGYTAVFDVSLSALGLSGPTPAVVGFNVWIEGRAPEYEQVFLAPPGRRLPADPMTFADLYIAAPPAEVAGIDLGVPTWMDNLGRIRLTNPSDRPATVRLQAHDRLAMRRKTTDSAAVTATVPAHGAATVQLPFFLDPEEKMESGGAQHLILTAEADGHEFYRAAWPATYCGPLSVYQRYGSELGPQAKPAPGDPYFGERMIRWMSSRLPRFTKLTTRDGAKSDFVIQAEDGSAQFDLMDPAAFDQMAAYVEHRFPSDFERMLALYCLDLEPAIGRHNSGGHHLMVRAEPISILRGNFAGGGGNCGFHSALFAGLAAHLHIQGRRLGARTVPVWGHDIMALDWRGSRALFDDDAGNLFFTPDGSDFATIEEFRANPWLLSSAGPGTIGRYYSFSEEAVRSGEPGVGGVAGPGIFPASSGSEMVRIEKK